MLKMEKKLIDKALEKQNQNILQLTRSYNKPNQNRNSCHQFDTCRNKKMDYNIKSIIEQLFIFCKNNSFFDVLYIFGSELLM